MPDLPDASVWLPLSSPGHVHYTRARRYWDFEAADEIAFCRVTAMALLRHLTNRQILDESTLSGGSAWRALETWLAVPCVIFLREPAGVDEFLRQWAVQMDLRGGQWTDAYLAAVATASGCRLVAFDEDFRRYPGLQFLHLQR
jgi:uncharacterized protein